MPDVGYKTFPSILASKGIVARYSDDSLPPGTYLNMDNMEELTENAMVSRLGSIIINRTLSAINALAGAVYSVGKLLGLATSVWRYAGAATTLYRRAGNTQGPYSAFTTGMSGNAWSWATYRPDLSSYPYIFIADSAKMIKDNGTLGTPQQWGIFAPAQPVVAVAQSPQIIILDEFNGSTGSYTFVNYTSPSISLKATTTLSSPVAIGLNTVTVGGTTGFQQYSLADVDTGGNAETVQIIALTATSITATFTKAHLVSTPVSESQLGGTTAASTTSTVTRAGSYGLTTFPNGVTVTEDDYLAIFLNVDQPNNIQEIRLLVDVSDGSFTHDYFYKVIAPAQYQSSVSDTVLPAQAVAQNVFNSALSVFGPGQINVAALATGDSNWSPVLTQLAAFLPVGNADVNSTTGFSFADAVAFQVQIVTNTNGAAVVGISDLVCFGGAGPDSFGGVSYDWVYTYYNAVTGAESNPCMLMSDVNPPQVTTFITPRRQPVMLTLLPSTDPQVTNIRVYQRGGTVPDNFFRLDQIPAGTTTYTAIAPDDMLESADPVSLVNDVPVTSTLPIPVSTVTTSPTGTGVITIPVASNVGISVNQQVTLGGITDPATEIVIVMAVGAGTFTAYVQNPHLSGIPVTAESFYGQPCNLCAVAYSAMWLAGDPNNPHYLYYSTNFSPESFGSGNFIEIGIPADPITAIVPFQGTLYVATYEHWYMVAPGQQTDTGVTAPTVYPTSAVHGVVATHGWVATESEIWHQAIDGIRTFAGSTSTYRTQEIEFLFQGNGVTPIVQAAPQPFSMAQTVMAYWNNIVFIGYVGVDNKFHRINYHTIYKRWRNDDLPASAMYTEPDINALIFGDSQGLIHQDRIGTYDEVIGPGGALGTGPISLNLQTAYLDQGGPKNQKNYNELTIDCNTGGEMLTATLLYNDGEFQDVIGNFSSTERAKINLNVNAGDGDQAYRASLQITGNTVARAILYQVDIRAVMLAETRQSYDSYILKFGTDESKICKQMYLEYTSTAPITFELFYDQFSGPQYTFTVPAATARTSLRVRFPAIKFRLFRMVGTSTADFQIWQDSKFEVKPVCSTKGYEVMNMMP